MKGGIQLASFPKIIKKKYYFYKNERKIQLTVAGEFCLITQGKTARPPFCAIIRVLFLVIKCDWEDVIWFWIFEIDALATSANKEI